MDISDEILANTITRNVLALLESQTAKGIAKYGNTVEPEEYTMSEWIQHAQEEIIDFLVYLEVIKAKCNESHFIKMAREHEHMRAALEIIATDSVSWTEPTERFAHINKIAKEGLKRCV